MPSPPWLGQEPCRTANMRPYLGRLRLLASNKATRGSARRAGGGPRIDIRRRPEPTRLREQNIGTPLAGGEGNSPSLAPLNFRHFFFARRSGGGCRGMIMFGKATVWGLLPALLLSAANVVAGTGAVATAMTLADIPLRDGPPIRELKASGSSATPSTTHSSAGTFRAPIAGAPVPAPRHFVETGFRRPNRWIFELRQGVRFHDGSIFDADAVIWNLERSQRQVAAIQPQRAGADDLLAVADRRLPQTRRLACRIADRRDRHSMPSMLNRFLIAARRSGKSSAATTGISPQPVGHEAVAAQILHPAAAGRAGAQRGLLGQGAGAELGADDTAADAGRLSARGGAVVGRGRLG